MVKISTFSAFLLLAGTGQAAPFTITDLTDRSVGVFEGGKPVFVYNHGVMHREGVPLDRARSTYIHPLYGLDGEVLTDDFPKDHYHNRARFCLCRMNTNDYFLADNGHPIHVPAIFDG